MRFVLIAQAELEALLWICFTPRYVFLIFEEKLFFRFFFTENLLIEFLYHIFFKFCPLKHLDVSLLFLKSSLLLCIKVSNFLGAQGALVDADFVNATFQIFACGLLNSIVFRNWKTVWVKSLVSLSYADTFNLATRLRTQPSVLSQ